MSKILLKAQKQCVVGRNDVICGTDEKIVCCAFQRSHKKIAFRKHPQICRDSQGTASWIRYTNPQK